MKLRPPRSTVTYTPLPTTTIFRSYFPALSVTLATSEKGRLIVTDVGTLRLHYARTLRQWYARTLAHEGEITAMMGDRFFRMWCFYLADRKSTRLNSSH